MKAFLSHSSRDKGIVCDVFNMLGAANAELDAETFDRGLLNVAAIQEALKRSSLYVLFLSHSAVASGMVRYEALQAQELVARGIMEMFLVVCLDESAFASADENWKGFNFVRKAVSAQSIARLVQSQLAVGQARRKATKQPFVGRFEEQDSVKTALSASGPKTAALYISGNVGIGRRTFAKRIFQDRFPAVNQLFPELRVDELDGTLEIYRKLNELITPISTLAAYRARIMGFTIAGEEQRAALIAQLLTRLLEARESLLVVDNGGLLTDDGKLQPIFKRVIELLGSQSYPPMAMIAERMVPRRYRSETPTIIFCPLPSLNTDQLKQLISFKLQDADISYTDEDVRQLTDLSDGHPFNVQMLVDAIREHTLKVFLADPSDFNQWKQRQGAAFLKKLSFSQEETRILAGLRDFRGLDFDTLVLLSTSELQVAGRAVARLLDLHIIEAAGEVLQISPPIRAAIERDSRFVLAAQDRRNALQVVSGVLHIDSEAKDVSISMIDAGVLATLQDGRDVPETFSVFLFPSHLVWLARRKYHEKRYRDCIRLSRAALEGADNRLSVAGQIEACRYLCLASAHRNEKSDFDFGISALRRFPSDARAKSNMNFLLGFNERLAGRLPEAEKYMRIAYDA
ncbi:MAG: toll/interleukin-1 receptor domain-containing protein, partial [Enhydrobacter sp.]|nr:toll/interleukin-1 receptor domain-containing protein [Enhydrobacter sp.]